MLFNSVNEGRINSKEVVKALQSFLVNASYEKLNDTGTVISVGDGIAKIIGLEEVQAEGSALNWGKNLIRAVEKGSLFFTVCGNVESTTGVVYALCGGFIASLVGVYLHKKVVSIIAKSHRESEALLRKEINTLSGENLDLKKGVEDLEVTVDSHQLRIEELDLLRAKELHSLEVEWQAKVISVKHWSARELGVRDDKIAYFKKKVYEKVGVIEEQLALLDHRSEELQRSAGTILELRAEMADQLVLIGQLQAENARFIELLTEHGLFFSIEVAAQAL